MNEIQNCDDGEASQEKITKNNDLVNSCPVSHSKFCHKNGNSISLSLIVLAVCISFVRYTFTNSPITNSITEPKADVVSYDNVEDTEVADTDVELEEDEEWEDEEELPTNESTVTTTDGMVTLGKGDTLAKVLEEIGINKSDIHGSSVAVSRVFHLKKIKPGLRILVKTNDNDKTSLKYLEFKPDKKFRIIVEKLNKRFVAKKVTVPLKRTVKKVSGTISPKSPTTSLQHCGLQKHIACDALRALAQVTDVSRAKSKVSFDLVYEQYHTEDGELLDGNLLAVVASIDGKIKRVYKFSIDGSMQYIDTNGTVLSSKRGGSMFIKPLHYKKITSQFGYRRHPISGRGKMHTGVDLSASIGTPVRATASGCVVMAQHYRGYGRYVKIKHSGNYNTAYAHLSRIVVSSGQFVQQGQVIGYSGNSGYSTGAHLHYEVMQNGKFINPLLFVPQPPQRLIGKNLVRFNTFRKSVDLNMSKSV